VAGITEHGEMVAGKLTPPRTSSPYPILSATFYCLSPKICEGKKSHEKFEVPSYRGGVTTVFKGSCWCVEGTHQGSPRGHLRITLGAQGQSTGIGRWQCVLVLHGFFMSRAFTFEIGS
jgi:hypothetical protein